MARTLRWKSFLTLAATAVLLPGVGFPGIARAQSAASGEFSVQKFAPAPGPRNFITVEGARTDGVMSWSGGLFVNYAANPFVLRSCVSETDCSSPNAKNSTDVKVIKTLVTADALASLTPFPRLQLGLRVPVSYVKGDGIDTTNGTATRDGLSGAGLGDPTLEGKFRAFGGPTDEYVIGVAGFVTGPVGHATAKDKYIGDSSPVVGVRGIFDGNAGPLSVGLNLAALYRGEEKLASTTLGPAIRYGFAAGFRPSPILRIIGEGFGETKLSSKQGTNAMEIDAALQISPLNSGINLYVGGGPGIIQGVGVPQFRAFGGFMYVGERGDMDGDGIPDDEDKCPNDPEDKDGFQDEDGCPDPDNDGDGIKDVADKCPNQPETMNGYQDEDGCPDELPDRDNDGITDPDDMCPDDGGPTVIRAKGKFYGCPDRDKDGVPDKNDKCPDEPEDTDGFQDEDGCPDPDNDGDGVLDAEDECVDVPGPKSNRGCPDPDTDGDGIPDSKDKCPKQPETYNGYQDEDGCPDKAPGGLVELTDDGIKILDKIEFATGSDKIVGAKSFKILDQVAAVLVANQSIFLVEIAGHTDNVGDAASNKTLSQKRAESVKTYLTEKKGVPAGKLSAAGYGQEKPVADNATAKGKQQNRRVEFNILKSTKKSGPAPAAAPAPLSAIRSTRGRAPEPQLARFVSDPLHDDRHRHRLCWFVARPRSRGAHGRGRSVAQRGPRWGDGRTADGPRECPGGGRRATAECQLELETRGRVASVLRRARAAGERGPAAAQPVHAQRCGALPCALDGPRGEGPGSGDPGRAARGAHARRVPLTAIPARAAPSASAGVVGRALAQRALGLGSCPRVTPPDRPAGPRRRTRRAPRRRRHVATSRSP